MDRILILLLRKGAHERALRLTTSELGALSGMSQQNASRRLAALEKAGMVQRGREGILITRKGMESLSGLYSDLKAALEPGALEISGIVVKGLGEGRFYMSQPGYRSQISGKLGFDPFPGTLNIRLDEKETWKRKRVLGMEPITISGFRDRERTFGDLFAYRCTLRGRGCAIIFPLRTHHGPDVMELVCPFNAKRELGLKDGDRIAVRA